MERRGRGDHHAVRAEREQVDQRLAAARLRCNPTAQVDRLRVLVRKPHDPGKSAGRQRLHPVPANPAETKKAKPRHCLHGILHGIITTAFTKPSGLSRVASSASSSRESG